MSALARVVWGPAHFHARGSCSRRRIASAHSWPWALPGVFFVIFENIWMAAAVAAGDGHHAAVHERWRVFVLTFMLMLGLLVNISVRRHMF